jgi:hypothetical protein
MPVTSLSKMLGHTGLSTTQLYLTGADPAVREQYQQAIQAWETDTPLAAPVPSPATVPFIPTPVLPEPAWPTFAEWATDLPEWVRTPCRAAVQQAMRHWKASQRRRQGQRRLQELAQFWRWQLARRPFQAWAGLTRADVQAFADDQLARVQSQHGDQHTLSAVGRAARL